MKTAKEEYLGILCKFYMIVLLAILPLYMQDGYYLLGDAKYALFRNCSFLCLGIWLVVETGSFLLDGIGKLMQGTVNTNKRGRVSGAFRGIVDICMLGYAGCVLLSAICSDYDTAWLGYADWHMGAVSQLLFVGIYFFVSRYFGYDSLTIYVGEAALLAVTILGLLNRLGIDILGVFKEFAPTDWEYSNLLSTIGNINWFCGYFSVMLVFPISGFLYSRRKVKTVILYFISVLGLVLLFIQGSDSGPVLVMTAIGCCLIAGWKKAAFFRKGLGLLGGTLFGVWMMGQAVNALNAWSAIPVDSWIYGKLLWNGWLVFAVAAGLLTLGFTSLGKRMEEKTLQKWIKIFICVMLLTIVTLAVLVVIVWLCGAGDAWGSGRGMLWRLAWEGFLQADAAEKFIGAGPDCFAEYLISVGRTPIITQEDHWANALFVNAHNEWLNHLVNIGILGVTAYMGIFIAALRRYRGMMLAMLVVAMYGVHSLVSFQQVLNTPLLFMVLGICEATWRRKMGVNDLTRE